MEILLIEDDMRIYEFLGRGLRAEGHNVVIETDGLGGFQSAQNPGWDVIILDLMLPIMDGREICKLLRANKNKTPILVLTALETTHDIVQGLRMGADDYLTKPFSFEELLARLEAIVRTSKYEEVASASQIRSDILTISDLEFNRDALTVQRSGTEITLTSLELSLLEFLMIEKGKVVSRARILEKVWGTSKDPLTNIVDVYVRRLRSKIDEPFGTKLIATVRNRGYRMADASV